MNIYSIKSNAEKIGGGFHKLSAYFHQHVIYREWGNMNHLPHIIEFSGNNQSQNIECDKRLHV